MEKRKRAKGISMVLLLMMVLQLMMPINSAYGDTIPPEDKVLSEGNGTDENTDMPEDEDSNIAEEEVKDTTEGADALLPNATTSAAMPVLLDSSGRDLGNIFTLEYMKINDKEIKDGDVIEIKDGTKVKIRFNWDTEGKNAASGDTAEIQLSDAFKKMTSPDFDLTVEGTNVGIYWIENGVLNFKFNEGIENSDLDVVKGWVELGLEFNLEKFKENIEQEISFNDSKDYKITVVALPNLNHSGITKEGHPDNKNNAKEITWTIDVINNSDESITGAQVLDDIPAGLGAARDFKINHLIVGYEGTIKEGGKTDISTAAFPVELGNIAPYKGYRVTFTTPIEDKDKEAFTNKAWFKYGDTSLPAAGTVNGLTRSNPIQKEGKHVKENGIDYIDWEIIVNENGQSIKNAIVKDENLPDGVSLVPGTIEITLNGKKTNIEAAAFPITLGEVAEDQVYRIKFRTQVDWSKVNSGEYLQNNGFVNNATLFDDDEELNNDDATVNINRDPILEKVGVNNVNYDNKTITWTVTVNKAKHPLKDVTVTDILPKGLSIDLNNVNNFTIKGDENGDFSKIVPTSTPQEGGTTKLEINLPNIGTETVTINYTTKVTNFTIDKFINNVGMTGTGVGEGGNGRDFEVNPTANTYTKSFSGMNYKDKTINWRLNVNPKREAIKTGFVITDTFTNDGLILLPDKLKIKLGKNDLKANEDYVLKPIDGHYKNGFTITFKREIKDAELVITYTTSYDPDLEIIPHSNDKEPGLYRNHAAFKGETENDNTIEENRDASHEINDDSWNSGKKEGQLVHFDDEGKMVKDGWVSGSERKIAWQFYFNYQQQNLGKEVIVTDTLAYEGTIDKESVVLYVYNVGEDGKINRTDEVLSSDNYTLDVKDNKQLILTFKNDFEVKERYVVTFITSVPKLSAGTYTNNAVVKVGEKEYPYTATVKYKEYDNFLNKSAVGTDGNKVFTGDEVNWQVRVNDSLSIIENDVVITDTISSGHVYKKGSLEIFKLVNGVEVSLIEDEDYNLSVIPNEYAGATDLKIELKDELKNTLILRYKTAVIETDGTIGNSISLEGNNIETKSVESERLSAEQFADAGGEWSAKKGAFEATKVDAETKKVIKNPAKFTLWYELNGEWVQFGDTVYTTENGILRVGNLPLRTYRLVEVESPTGYFLTEGKYIEIEVTKGYNNNEENVVKKEFENTKEKIDVKGTKIWDGGPETKPTVWFKLYRQLSGKESEPVPDAETQKLEHGTTEVSWNDVDKTNIDGVEYAYSVKEVDESGNDFTPENYVKAENGLKVTNSYVSPTDASAKAIKVWAGLPEGRNIEKPTVWFKLFRYVGTEDAQAVPGAEIKELKDGITEVVWTKLEKTNHSGQEYSFLVKEVNEDGNDFVPENYKKSEDGLTVTNTYTKKDVTATKVWNGGSSPRPTIWFELYRQVAGGELKKVEGIKELADGVTEVTWEDLDKTDEYGNAYIYSVKEVNADGNDFVPSRYRKSEDGLTVVNTKRPTGGGEDTKPPTDKPTNPDKPEEPNKPVEPTVPVDPTVPVEPITPVEPDASAKGSILINKVDEKSMALPGAEFTLYDENNSAIGTAVSDKDGKVMFENLEDGKYFVRETKAPENYAHVDTPLEVTVIGGNSYSYKFRNVPEGLLIQDPDVPMGWEDISDPDVPTGTLPNTGHPLNTWMLGFIGLSLILAGVVLNKKRKFID